MRRLQSTWLPSLLLSCNTTAAAVDKQQFRCHEVLPLSCIQPAVHQQPKVPSQELVMLSPAKTIQTPLTATVKPEVGDTNRCGCKLISYKVLGQGLWLTWRKWSPSKAEEEDSKAMILRSDSSQSRRRLITSPLCTTCSTSPHSTSSRSCTCRPCTTTHPAASKPLITRHTFQWGLSNLKFADLTRLPMIPKDTSHHTVNTDRFYLTA